MIKLKNLLVLSVILLLSCAQSQNVDHVPKGNFITLSGKVNYPQNGFIILEKFNMSNNSFAEYDTLTLNNEQEFKRDVYFDVPGYFRLNFYDKQFVNLIFDNENINVEVDGNDVGGAVTITGSSDIDKLNQLSEIIKEFSTREGEINSKFSVAAQAQDMEEVNRLRALYMEIQTEKSEAIKQEIGKMGTSLAAMQAVNLLDKDKEFTFVDDLTQKLLDKYPDVEFVNTLSDEIERLRKVAIGEFAPEISLPNPDGKVVKLSSLRGNYVLVDFWAEWCKPCRAENPNIVRAYNRFKDKGFKIFGVSLDRNRARWLKGIADDGLIWTQVSDLKYFNSAAAREYNINAIPFSILLDPEGKIIAKNLRGEALHKKLEEIYGT